MKNKLCYGVFRETVDIGLEKIGQSGAADEIGWYIAEEMTILNIELLKPVITP